MGKWVVGEGQICHPNSGRFLPPVFANGSNSDKKDSSYGSSLRYLPDFSQLSNSVAWNAAANMLTFHLAARMDCYLI